jgi:phasin family protein
MNYGFENFYSKVQEAAAPWSEITGFGFDAVEKGFQLQAELIGDALDFAVDELKAASAATNPAEYFQAQTKLAEEYAVRLQKRAQGLVDAASEAQATLAGLAERSFKQAQGMFEETVVAAQSAAPKASRKKAA